jgi:hypothetical protein
MAEETKRGGLQYPLRRTQGKALGTRAKERRSRRGDELTTAQASPRRRRRAVSGMKPRCTALHATFSTARTPSLARVQDLKTLEHKKSPPTHAQTPGTQYVQTYINKKYISIYTYIHTFVRLKTQTNRRPTQPPLESCLAVP